MGLFFLLVTTWGHNRYLKVIKKSYEYPCYVGSSYVPPVMEGCYEYIE
jgi:hypothetical protein